jgi:lipopolysaccharide export system protein LptA
MVGTGDVDVEAKEFIGRGDRISYNQQHDRIIFEGSRGSPATLYRQKRLGLKPDEFKGEKIWYYRREDRVNVENASQLDFIELEADKKHQDIFRK